VLHGSFEGKPVVYCGSKSIPVLLLLYKVGFVHVAENLELFSTSQACSISLLPSHHSIVVLLRHWMQIFCAKCKSQEALLDNDIILCDGACNRGFHQYCLDPPLATINSKIICCNLGHGSCLHESFSNQKWSTRGWQIAWNVTNFKLGCAVPPGDEGWLCPVCECKMECVEVINAYLSTNFEVENSWEVSAMRCIHFDSLCTDLGRCMIGGRCLAF